MLLLKTTNSIIPKSVIEKDEKLHLLKKKKFSVTNFNIITIRNVLYHFQSYYQYLEG